MSEYCIPVDVHNPGQVFACCGFLELADLLYKGTRGRFCWENGDNTRFHLSSPHATNPFEAVLDFLANAKIDELAPIAWSNDQTDKRINAHSQCILQTFPSKDEVKNTSAHKKSHKNELPIRLIGERNGDSHNFFLSHWIDGSGRDSFKLYAGGGSAHTIANNMLGQIKNLLQGQREDIIAEPFDVLLPLKGTFNFDPRKTWTAIDTGFSPDAHNYAVTSSPITELLAACGLEHARPYKSPSDSHIWEYSIWKDPFTPMLARAALGGGNLNTHSRRFSFELKKPGKNSITTYAIETKRS